MQTQAASEPSTLRSSLIGAGVAVALLWGIFVAQLIILAATEIDIAQYGIHPRSGWGLLGILSAPFLHGSWGHLIANSSALLILGTVALRYHPGLAMDAVGSAIIIGGGLTWLIGDANSVHIGASGVVFGLVAWLLANAVFRRSCGALIIGGATFFLYGGALYGMLPSEAAEAQRISWEGHLGGFLGGVLASWASKDEK